MEDREESVQHFLDLIKRSRRGKFKIYIGMIAGVGKSYRMLQEAHEMLENGVDRLYCNARTCRNRCYVGRIACYLSEKDILQR